MRLCSKDECGTKHYSLGYCLKHYKRLVTKGSADWEPPTKLELCLRSVVCRVDTRCWEWTGYRNRHGYGCVAGGTAYGVIYKLMIGPVPKGYHLDHLCRNRACVNPDHLEPVTQQENIARSRDYVAAANRRRGDRVTHCPQGHPYDAENTRLTKDGWRACRECGRQRKREWYAKKVAA